MNQLKMVKNYLLEQGVPSEILDRFTYLYEVMDFIRENSN